MDTRLKKALINFAFFWFAIFLLVTSLCLAGWCQGTSIHRIYSQVGSATQPTIHAEDSDGGLYFTSTGLGVSIDGVQYILINATDITLYKQLTSEAGIIAASFSGSIDASDITGELPSLSLPALIAVDQLVGNWLGTSGSAEIFEVTDTLTVGGITLSADGTIEAVTLTGDGSGLTGILTNVTLSGAVEGSGSDSIVVAQTVNSVSSDNVVDGSLTGDDLAADIVITNATATKLDITTGRIGVGTNNPLQRLHISSDSNDNQIILESLMDHPNASAQLELQNLGGLFGQLKGYSNTASPPATSRLELQSFSSSSGIFIQSASSDGDIRFYIGLRNDTDEHIRIATQSISIKKPLSLVAQPSAPPDPDIGSAVLWVDLDTGNLRFKSNVGGSVLEATPVEF